MRLFWSIILIFATVAGAMLWMHLRTNETFAQPSMPPEGYDSAPASAQGTDAQVVPDRTNDAASGFNNAASELVEDLLSGRDGDRLGGNGGAAPPIVATPGGSSLPGSLPGADDGEHATEEPQFAENPWMTNAESGERSRLPSKAERQPDGSLLLDETFTIRGDGSKEKPYEITWDLLMSAAETYQPRLGMDEIPLRISMLDGKHVKISGYLMFPTAAFQATELLVMLNMWDGCCIGTMPSPYDAVEVQLAAPVSGANRQFLNYGTIEGKLLVDPYLLNDWLIGLYLLEEATLKMDL